VPLADAPMRVLQTALRDPTVVAMYRAKVLEAPASDCLWWSAAVSGRGHGRFYVGTVATGSDGDGVGRSRDLMRDRAPVWLRPGLRGDGS
jgi:hypothetical protein